MHYLDNNEALLGDVISIAGKHRGTVVASIDRQEYSLNFKREEWEYLKEGIIVDTTFCGLVHYRQGDDEDLTLVERAAFLSK